MLRQYFIFIFGIAILTGGYWVFTSERPQQIASVEKKVQKANPTITTIPIPSCIDKPTPEVTEGPYYKSGSPQKTTFVEEDTIGTRFTLTGYVLDSSCRPVANAWLDFWQTDGQGIYDNDGFKRRGHQFTDSMGRYVLYTVIPGEYPERTSHIHVKIRATDTSSIKTTQLFFPDNSQNTLDSIFDESLVITITNQEGTTGEYNFVIEK